MAKYPPYKYSPYLHPIQDEKLITIGKQLAAFGHLSSQHIGDEYNVFYYQAVKDYQYLNEFEKTGILEKVHIDHLEKKYNSQITGDDIVSEDIKTDTSAGQFIEPAFFDEDRESVLRGANYNIVISIGDDGQYVKTVQGVRVRSKTIIVDASGVPIAESYEFIAKDVIENTEPTDLN